jgi:hypothetical protein
MSPAVPGIQARSEAAASPARCVVEQGSDLPVAEPAGEALVLERWTFAPGTTETRVSDERVLVLLGQTGALTVTITPGGDGAVPVSGGKKGTASVGWAPPAVSAVRLSRGEVAVVSPRDRVALRNDGTEPAVALAVVVTLPEPPGAVRERPPGS